MSQSNKPVKKENEPVAPTMSLRELGEVLVRHYGLKKGKYEVLVEFMIGVGNVGPSPDNRLPGATFGLSKIGLTKSQKDGPHTVDAEEVLGKKIRGLGSKS
ncbi:MAG TPA: hypothetical protein ENO10_01540 [Salinimicrobium catena]|uniref:Uncharacterized protein n=1 Tax=Salinimicrobium catena TaxID=390640 RepID=A0A7C2MD65_9FLAO|nr:hypothetical protein [Salinimicrobium catena]